jgi:tetratricopeptide (TPR) repeat protein
MFLRRIGAMEPEQTVSLETETLAVPAVDDAGPDPSPAGRWRRAMSRAGHGEGAKLLKDGLHRSSHLAHPAAALWAFATDVIKPTLPRCGIATVVVFSILVAALLVVMRVRRAIGPATATALVFCVMTLVLSGGVIALQYALGDEEQGVTATLLALKQDTAAIRARQEQQAREDAARHDEAMRLATETNASLDETRQRVDLLLARVDTGGATAAQALKDIRELLRPGVPEIDNLPDEKLPGVLKQTLEKLSAPAARPEDFAGAVRQALAEAQASAAKLAFPDAKRILTEALARADAEDKERARGRAALLAERGRVSGLQLQYREAATDYLAAADLVAFDPAAAWNHALYAADALESRGDEFGDNAALVDAIAMYRDKVLPRAPRSERPYDWAATQNNLGLALWALGERESGTAHLEEAVAAFRAVLEEMTRDRVPLGWAATQNNLGLALWTLGERESGTARLEEAVAAFRAALEEKPRDRVPLSWATTQNNLGLALQAIGERESGTGTARLEEAVAAYDAALEELPRDRVPLKWAGTQSNLGNALSSLGERELGTEVSDRFQNGRGVPNQALRDRGDSHLADAVAAYRLALEEWTRDRVPLKWAGTQNNLGIALRVLSERDSGTVRLEEAVAAFRQALEETTRDRAPHDWAGIQVALGNSLEELALRLRDPVRMKEAISRMRAAVSVYQEGADKYALPIAETRVREMEASLAFMEP